MLDAIGWEEPDDHALDQVARLVCVDRGLAVWAQEEASKLERCFKEMHVNDSDLEVLSGLQLIAEAVA